MIVAVMTTALAGTVKAESYTITFNSQGQGDGTSVSTSTDCSTIVSAGESYLSGKVAQATYVYHSGQFGLKLGKSGSAGSIKLNLANSVTPTSIVVSAKRYRSDKPVTLSVNGSTAQDLTTNFSDYTYNINEEISYIQLNSSNYSWIKSITINYSSGGTPTPSITVAPTTIEVPAEGKEGTIEVTYNNITEVVSDIMFCDADGNETTYDWIYAETNDDNNVDYSIETNEGEARTAYLKVWAYDDEENEVYSDLITITQAAAPVIYSTIPDLFEAATSTATDVTINFGGWVVSAVKGDNAYLTDNQGHGLIIYASNHGFQVNDVLTGTVSCKLITYKGSAELTNLTSSTTGLSVANTGSITEQNIPISELGGVNTGALVAYESLTYNGTALVDDNNNAIKPYNTLYSHTFENGKQYNVKGIYLQYNTTKEILPRSANDVEEIETPVESHTLTIANPDNVTITATYDTDEILVNGNSAEVEEETEVTLFLNIAEGYVFDGLTITGAEGQTVTPVPVSGYENVYTFTMPAYDVTVSATVVEYVAPSGSDYVRITSLDQLVNGAKVIIAARYDEEHTNGYYAMPNTTSGKPDGVAFTSVTLDGNETLPTTISNVEDSYYWTVNVTSDGYTFMNANNQMIGYTSSTNFATGGDNTEWTITCETAKKTAMVAEYTGFVIRNGNTNTRAFAFNGTAFGAYATTNMSAPGYNFYLDFFVVAPETEEVSVSDLKYSTYASDKALDFTGSSIKAFYPTVDGTTLIFHEITKVPADTGVLLYSANGAVTEDILVCTGETDAVENNVFVRGTGASVTYNDATQEYIYVLSKPQDDNLGFYKANNNRVATNRAYIQVPAELSGAKSFTINLEDDPTGIINLNDNVNANEGAIYNLAGQRLGKMQKGINIINGKKVLK